MFRPVALEILLYPRPWYIPVLFPDAVWHVLRELRENVHISLGKLYLRVRSVVSKDNLQRIPNVTISDLGVPHCFESLMLPLKIICD